MGTNRDNNHGSRRLNTFRGTFPGLIKCMQDDANNYGQIQNRYVYATLDPHIYIWTKVHLTPKFQAALSLTQMRYPDEPVSVNPNNGKVYEKLRKPAKYDLPDNAWPSN
jgi:hypothetical protein